MIDSRRSRIVGFLVLGSALFALPATAADSNVKLPAKENLHLYLLIGQSNMAGRGTVEEQDKQSHPRVLTFTRENTWALAVDPLHFDKPAIAGVGVGSTFGRALADANPGVTIGLIPCAVGGTPLERWRKRGDLYQQAVERAQAALQDGTLKGILWHQGEADSADDNLARSYGERLAGMVSDLRKELAAGDAPFVAGELGQFLAREREGKPSYWLVVNEQLALLPLRVTKSTIVKSEGLKPKADGIHFDSPSLREFGRRYAIAMQRLQAEGKSAIAPAATRRPNVVVFLADDMGYSDLGCYGGEIATPNLDGLAKNGLRFTQFYNTARCWPTRSSLLTGYYAQQIRRDAVPGVRSGGQGVRPVWARLLPEMLKPLGYRSYHSGKWHVDGQPLEGGFDHSYLLQDAGRFFSPRVHFEDGEKLPVVEASSGYYSTTAIADYAIKHLKEHAEKHIEQPFFSFVAFLSPHFPLQAMQSDIDKYAGKYTPGWEAMRQARWQRIESLGLVRGKLSQPEREVGPPYDFPDALKALGPGEVNRPLPWKELTAEQQKFQATKMSVHAAMVDRMDQDVGRVLAQLRAMNALDNTLIMFLSDNGASAEIMVRDDGHDPAAPPGSAATHLCLGPGWATVANTPLRMHKTWVHEGGISTPLVVHWPRGISARGELRHNPGHVIDLVPTILDLAGGKRPESFNNESVPSPPGKSLLPAFAKDGSVARDYLFWLHEGSRAIRVGDWKLVAASPSLRGRGAAGARQETPGDWELFNLAEDRAETINLAAKMPDKVGELEQLWTQRRDEFFKLATKDSPSTTGK